MLQIYAIFPVFPNFHSLFSIRSGIEREKNEENDGFLKKNKDLCRQKPIIKQILLTIVLCQVDFY